MNATISLAMIVRDSAKTLEKCLSGFVGTVDEMVIVDTGSVDNTVEIARKYTDKIHNFKWINDFAAARNYSFSKCTKEFVLWMDSDDYILPEDAQKIRDLDFSDKDIIICHYHYAHDEFGATRLIVPRERILRRSLGHRWEQRIHEYLPIIGKGKQYVSNIATHHDKQHGTSERNLAILEEIVKESPDTRNIYYLGKELLDFGRTDEGIEWLTEFTERKDWFWEDLYHAHYMLANAYLNKGNDDKFFQHMFHSIRIEPRRAEPYYAIGWYHHAKHEWSKAIQWYETCMTVKRPTELLAGYMPEYYTWLPALQCCVCYNALGDTQKAREYNQKVLNFRPADSRAVNNEKILGGAVARNKIESRQDGGGRKLHLGCGGKILPGWTNVDLFKGSGVDEVFELDDIPYKDGTISAILSEHSLEHVPFARVDSAVAEWARVLKPGGDVTLYLPDLEGCARKYLEAPIEAKNFMNTKMWYKNTIFGIQKSQAGEPDDAQIHKSGFSKAEMACIMERHGFLLDYCENYGGPGQKPSYGTPSFAIRAVRPQSNLKVGWIAPLNWDAAQTRIRVLNVHRWMRARGYRSEIVNYPEIINQNYDVAIVGKGFDENHFKNVKWLKRQGKTVVCDLCEDLVSGEWAWVKEIVGACDKVVCCSHTLADKVRPINPNVLVIEDAWEF